MAITSCRHPGCDQPAIGACANCGDIFCSRHIWKADYGAVVALCYRCHEQAAALERARAREAAAYTVIVVLLLFCAAGISYSLHYLRHIDPELSKWAFWLFLAGSVAALGRLGILVARF
jgi:hypothetical protein